VLFSIQELEKSQETISTFHRKGILTKLILYTYLKSRIRPFENIKRLAQEQEIKVLFKTEVADHPTDNSETLDENLIRFDHQRLKWIK